MTGAYKKPALSLHEVEEAIGRHLGSGATQPVPIDGSNGNLSRVYSFDHGGRGYVIKFSDLPGSYVREPVLSRLLADRGIPYPRCIAIGDSGSLCYVLSERAEGKLLIECTAEERIRQLPEVIRWMVRMGETDLAGTRGFGWIQASGDGAFDSWSDFVDANYREDQAGTFWEGWHGLFETSMLERDVFEEIHARLLTYLPYNAPYRHFIHGDYHPWNILSDGKRITAIIDGNSAYGDWLVDLAVLDRHVSDTDVIRAFEAYMEKAELAVPHFRERLLGAYYYKGLDGLRFYAKMERRDAHDHLRNFLLALE